MFSRKAMVSGLLVLVCT